ncbi:MAG: cation transporter [Firmicutes bacterium]|nr:cation transporter [Bacillota bacterium]
MEETRYEMARRVSLNTMIGNILLTAVKAGVGIISQSSALIADALHSASDIATTLVVMYSMRISKLPPDPEHPYGHGRAESIGAKVLSVILVLVGLSMGTSSIRQLWGGTYVVPGRLALWAILLSIVTKEGMYRYTVAVGRTIDSTALIADALHHRSDAFSSVAAFLGVIGARLGYPVLDPLAAAVVAIFIVRMGIEVFRSSLDELMDAQVHETLQAEVHQYANGIPGVQHVDDVRIRRYGPQYVIDLKVSVDHHLTVKEGHEIAAHVKGALRDSLPSVGDVLVHVNPYPDQHDLVD